MRHVLLSLALAVSGLAIGLVLVELALGVAMPAAGCRHRPPLWQPDARVGWSLVPGTTAEAVVCDGDRVVHHRSIDVNALGQRDRPRQVARRPDVRRVAVLGDSFVEAVQVPFEQTFLARIEDAGGVEMLNFGVSGYSTDNEIRTWLVRGRRYRPDGVLLFVFIGNDVLENGARLFLRHPRGLLPKRWLRARHASPRLDTCLAMHRGAARAAARIPTLLWTSSRLARFVATEGVRTTLQVACGEAADTSGVPVLLAVYGEPRTIAWREAWQTTERAIGRLARRTRASGVAFGVVLVPMGYEVDARLNPPRTSHPEQSGVARDWGYPARRLLGYLAAEHIPALSLLEPLTDHARTTGRMGYYPGDGHWDAEGHAVVAQAVAPFVERLLERTPSR